MENLKILATSDLHGHLPEITTPFDLLLICGDICPAHSHYFSYQINWFQHDFANWINTLPFKNEWSKVVMVWGNHDFVGLQISKEHVNCFNITTKNRVKILNNEDYNFEYFTDNGIKTLKIFGTPYCHIFGDWAFMVNDETLKRYYSFMPENCDIVISHDSPSLNNIGTITEGWNSGYDAGNLPLAEEIKKKRPKYFFSGHIHSGNHNLENIEGTKMANVSYINEKYKPSYEILQIEI